MKYGVSTFLTDEGIRPDEYARALEERGFESMFVPEHTHIPVSEQGAPWGGELPRPYFRSLDPFVSLAMAAAATGRLRLATGIALIVQRDPITLAKEVASLDHLSGGRVIVGIGIGWNRTEMRDHGTDPTSRTAVARERILAMKEIWTREEAEFHGRHVNFDPIYAWPKPIQQPHPPLLLGGWGASTFDRIIDHADGWLTPPGARAERVVAGITELRRRAEEAGRQVSVTAYLRGDADRADVARFIELGVERLVVGVDTAPRDATLRRLDELAAFLGTA